MFLYHYSKTKYKVLKTLEAQRTITAKEQTEAQELQKQRRNVPPGLYYQHISFFLEPLSTSHWRHYPKNHPVWFKGNSLVEYTVDTSQIGDFKWMLVETPEILELLQDPDLPDEVFWKQYVKINLSRYVGEGDKGLDRVAKPFVGKMDRFLKLAKASNWTNNNKYAAGVPHVMLYPKDGMVLFESTRELQFV